MFFELKSGALRLKISTCFSRVELKINIRISECQTLSFDYRAKNPAGATIGKIFFFPWFTLISGLQCCYRSFNPFGEPSPMDTSNPLTHSAERCKRHFAMPGFVYLLMSPFEPFVRSGKTGFEVYLIHNTLIITLINGCYPYSFSSGHQHHVLDTQNFPAPFVALGRRGWCHGLRRRILLQVPLRKSFLVLT